MSSSNELIQMLLQQDRRAPIQGVIDVMKRRVNGGGRQRQRQRDPNDWNYGFDNKFALEFITAWPKCLPLTWDKSFQCCKACSSLVTANVPTRLTDLRTAGNGCNLCPLLRRKIESLCKGHEPDIEIVRDCSALRAGTERRRILRVCSDSDHPPDPNNNIQISFPVLPKARSPEYFALLRAWLSQCDESSDCKTHNTEAELELPTRLLWVGEPDHKGVYSDTLRLSTHIDKGRYIALSHCWGNTHPDKEGEHFCTTRANVERRKNGFPISELPQTFKDAITVTRELRVQYLWIDSVCIIQHENDDCDWKQEVERMEAVYSSAYCTIAATSAKNSYAGFLERNVSIDYVLIQDTSGRRFYICDDIDDFENDVEKAPLNKRAWVTQERFLSRRTIHFTHTQMYWECGEGVYCENLTRLRGSSRRKKCGTLDPKFPQRLSQADNEDVEGCEEFIESLFEDYSKRGLTQKTDRSKAIRGLVTRVAKVLKCRSEDGAFEHGTFIYGVFGKYVHRNLLWKASDGEMEEILYIEHVPSWSWMAYHGGIEFLGNDIEFGELSMMGDLRFEDDGRTMVARMWKFGNKLKLKEEVNEKLNENYAVLDSGHNKRGWIQYDVKAKREESRDLCEERCIIVGRNTAYYYILVTKLNPKGQGKDKRIGVGRIQYKYLERQSNDMRVM